VEDEARIDALLAEASELAELEDHSGAAPLCPDGVGYRPPAEQAQRLASIDEALEGMASDRSLFFEGGLGLPLQSSSTLSSAAEGGGASYLTEMKQKRSEDAALDHIRDRLAELNSRPSTDPASTEAELHALAELLGAARAEAERQVDSRPSSARPLSAGAPPPPPPIESFGDGFE